MPFGRAGEQCGAEALRPGGRGTRRGVQAWGMVEDIEDPRRSEPAFVLPEREMLKAWLDFHRVTLLLKCEGLDESRGSFVPLRHRSCPSMDWFATWPSGTGSAGCWRDEDASPIWYDPAIDDSELVPLDDADWAADLRTWQAECDASRQAAASRDLDDTGVRQGRPCSLRWIYVHMIEEYARHNGHADLLASSPTGELAGRPPRRAQLTSVSRRFGRSKKRPVRVPRTFSHRRRA